MVNPVPSIGLVLPNVSTYIPTFDSEILPGIIPVLGTVTFGFNASVGISTPFSVATSLPLASGDIVTSPTVAVGLLNSSSNACPPVDVTVPPTLLGVKGTPGATSPFLYFTPVELSPVTVILP